jgi:hypothetical protein
MLFTSFAVSAALWFLRYITIAKEKKEKLRRSKKWELLYLMVNEWQWLCTNFPWTTVLVYSKEQTSARVSFHPDRGRTKKNLPASALPNWAQNFRRRRK